MNNLYNFILIKKICSKRFHFLFYIKKFKRYFKILFYFLGKYIYNLLDLFFFISINLFKFLEIRK